MTITDNIRTPKRSDNLATTLDIITRKLHLAKIHRDLATHVTTADVIASARKTRRYLGCGPVDLPTD